MTLIKKPHKPQPCAAQHYDRWMKLVLFATLIAAMFACIYGVKTFVPNASHPESGIALGLVLAIFSGWLLPGGSLRSRRRPSS